MKIQKGSIFLLIVFIFFLTGCGQGDVFTSVQDGEKSDSGSQTEAEHIIKSSEDAAETNIYVYVCGHVNQPGVYQLSKDSRICDAITLAGGITEDGNGEVLNQAEHMTDGQTLYVPGRGEEENKEQTAQDDGLLDINTAGKEEFMTLPGIGEAKADIIIRYREEHGAFQSIEELMNIPGIKEGVFNKIKSSIKVS